MTQKPTNYVTLGGDCLEISPQGIVDPVTRDGLLFKFHTTDLKKNHPMRLVSVFAAASLEITVSATHPGITTRRAVRPLDL